MKKKEAAARTMNNRPMQRLFKFTPYLVILPLIGIPFPLSQL
ncbi:hypothetical protein [Hornefia butyriciproducens]|nr:hypothetical protein [Hornefia butyriciproducens]